MDLNRFLSNLLFPGIIFHELSHVIACLFMGVKIKKIKWISSEGGYVVHEDAQSYKIITIALFPAIFNLFIALVCARIYIFNLDLIVRIIVVWFALAALFFSLPSSQDAQNVFDALKENYKKKDLINILLNIILLPLNIIIIIIALLFKIIDKSLYFRLLLVLMWIFLFTF